MTLVCLRYFLIGGAIVVGVCGVIESVCAGYFIYQLYEYSPLTPSNVCGSTITLLVMGLITCMIAWCAWQFLDFTNRGQVMIFSIALIIVTILNTSAGIWALVRHEQVDLLPISHLEHAFELAMSDDKSLWDRMHSKLRCCGINGPADYRNQNAVPWSCCDMSSFTSPNDDKGICTTMYAHGCQHVVMNRTRSILLHIFLLALCTVLLQVCFITCMSCYVRACRERMARRKELMVVAQSFARTSKDLGTDDSLLNQQSKYSKASNDV
ncbi:PREDICTED: leukocyte surface antigen CD53-like isoform X2 [Eufriesea mexicana]|uniref:leukocyte surface antigen CD53-like isoform X2 n=1 Tax=Eufriesea mexicana TaxID=516756 RepID=UPI00083BB317|nr:PREDICTED: leukocyte surface antigen CD53-like isoform X2 [Eufriesea mexicana]